MCWEALHLNRYSLKPSKQCSILYWSHWLVLSDLNGHVEMSLQRGGHCRQWVTDWRRVNGPSQTGRSGYWITTSMPFAFQHFPSCNCPVLWKEEFKVNLGSHLCAQLVLQESNNRLAVLNLCDLGLVINVLAINDVLRELMSVCWFFCCLCSVRWSGFLNFFKLVFWHFQ